MGNSCARSNRSNPLSVSSKSPHAPAPESPRPCHPVPQPLRASAAVPASSRPRTTSPSSRPSPPQSSAQSSRSIRKVNHLTGHASNVPFVQDAILDFTIGSNTPESNTKHGLLSDDASKNSIALFGMGGAGKTTVLCVLGRDRDIKAKFTDGVWLFELGHDVTLSSFIPQIQKLVKFAFPDFLEDFKELAASEDTHLSMITQLMDRLVRKHFLLLFDDLWDFDTKVYDLVRTMCRNVHGNDTTSLKSLTSTRSRDIADVLTPNGCIPLNPQLSGDRKNFRIFLHNASISANDIRSLSPQNRNALYSIINTCGGLPLALSVAGSAVKRLMDPSSNHCDHNAISEYWGLLKPNAGLLARESSKDGHKGLENTVETSIQFLEKSWAAMKNTTELADHLTVGEMFESLCIMQKRMCLPVSVIEKLWGVKSVQAGVRMLSRNSLVSEVREKDKGIVGVRVHDILLDMSMGMANDGDGATKWHARLLDAYRLSMNSSCSADDRDNDGQVSWWDLDKNDKYMLENVVRHLLGAGRATDALKLLIDYRWVERMNEDEDRAPFHKMISDLKSLQSYLVEHERTETSIKVTRDIDTVANAMRLCMVPYCVNNRDECTFQLFGRLREVRSKSGIVEWLVRSIEQNGQRPWARAGPGLLASGESLLRRVLDVKFVRKCMYVGSGGDEVIVGGYFGQVLVVNGWDGSKKISLVGYENDESIMDVYSNRLSRTIYSCSSTGKVIVWKDYKISHSFQAEELQEHEKIWCMQVLPQLGRVVLGTDVGRLMVINVESERTIQTVTAHNGVVSSLTAGQSGDVVVSGSWDGTIRVWDALNFENTENELGEHKLWVNSVALSGDGRLLASGSNDQRVRIFNMETREQLWSSSDEHSYQVERVLFSGDANALYSADRHGAICVWRLSNGGRNVSLVHTLCHSTMRSVKSLGIGDDLELFALQSHRIHVWDARAVDIDAALADAVLPDVNYFAFSDDDATILTLNVKLKCLEIRDVCDVSNRIDRVVSFVYIGNLERWPNKFVVSNNRKLVAVSVRGKCELRIYNSYGFLLRTLSDLQQLALASIRNQEGNSSSPEAPDDSGGLVSYNSHTSIKSLWFSSDGSAVSVIANVALVGEDGMTRIMTSKPISWNVSSGEVLTSELQVDGESTACKTSIGPRMNCEAQSSALSVEWDGMVTCEHKEKSFVVATLEDDVHCSHYCPNTSRLWLAKDSGGVFYIDLISENTQTELRDDLPSLPSLQPPPPAPQDAAEHTAGDLDDEAEETYDVFISHAGTDKVPIAVLLYKLLVDLGLKVFLDRAELRPGQNAPQKMINAMRTAKIAVVILSPEFAARKWTMKELMCFLERFDAHGERGVIIIPVFYRLSLDECKNQRLLARLRNEDGEYALAADGLLERMGEGYFRMEEIMDALRAVSVVTGIENTNGVTNGDSAKEVAERIGFVESIKDAVVEAIERLKSGRAGGPSGLRE